MDPFSIFLALSFASAGLGAVGSMMETQAQSTALRESAFGRMADVGALMKTGQFTETQMREEGQRLKSAQRVAYASSGVELSTGTPLKVLTDTAYKIERDIQQYKQNVQLETEQQTRAAYRETRAARRVEQTGPLRTITQLLGSGANIALSGGM